MRLIDSLRKWRHQHVVSRNVAMARTRNRLRYAIRPTLETLEDRLVLATDFGDAPDLGLGTGAGNYQTVLTDNGPFHTIVPGLKLGAMA